MKSQNTHKSSALGTFKVLTSKTGLCTKCLNNSSGTTQTSEHNHLLIYTVQNYCRRSEYSSRKSSIVEYYFRLLTKPLVLIIYNPQYGASSPKSPCWYRKSTVSSYDVIGAVTSSPLAEHSAPLPPIYISVNKPHCRFVPVWPGAMSRVSARSEPIMHPV